MSHRRSRYRPPQGFVLRTSRVQGLELYHPLASHTERCSGCAAFRTAEVCVRCGGTGILVAPAVELDLDQARERALAWVEERPFVCDPARASVQALVQTLDLQTAPAALRPQYRASFEWRQRTGQIVVDAVDGRVWGDRPTDTGRLWRSSLLGLLPGLAVGLCMGLPTLVFAGLGLLFWCGALVLLVWGHLRWRRLARQADRW